ncbi:hypothetical protein GW17_00022217 [Ensete ventricosum]|nr:hypothetical protein GW17_00022217 [Ensete ventricosum]
MWTARYRAVPPKIDRQQSISVIGGRLKGEIDRRRLIEREINRQWSIEREKGRKKKKRKKKKKKRNTYCQHVVLACASSSPASRQRSRVVAARGSWALFLPRGEKDRGNVRLRTGMLGTALYRYGIGTGWTFFYSANNLPCVNMLGIARYVSYR